VKKSAPELVPRSGAPLVAEHQQLLTEVSPASQEPLFRIGGCQVVSEVAAGGMAVLYRGVQESLERPVAIKALRTDVARNPGSSKGHGDGDGPDWIDRFVREARLLGLLQHENLIHVYDLIEERGAFGERALFIIMELCEGIDLLDVLTRLPVLPVDVAALVALHAARALAHIHAAGVLHRDLKPSNLVLGSHGVVKLVDFGTAWDPRNPRDRFGADVGLGTPSYMSPEQALGEPLDHRSDQFALGVVLYQLLAGRKPFVETADRGELLRQVVGMEPPPLRKLSRAAPRDLVKIVERCLHKERRRRYDATDELVLALEGIVRRLLPAPDAGQERRRLRAFVREMWTRP
jgi:serine/threonine-protein kinase